MNFQNSVRLVIVKVCENCHSRKISQAQDYALTFPAAVPLIVLVEYSMEIRVEFYLIYIRGGKDRVAICQISHFT